MVEKESLNVKGSPDKSQKEPSPFWVEHQDRIVYMAIATAFGTAFCFMGMPGEGRTILIAVATLALNKARSKVANGKP